MQKMAQAARLNLRLQKELKLLVADPPPGVSLPSLSDNPEESLVSLLSIEAYVEGPEETVYSKGIFTIKIQIPERYPFQPPNVTFLTPIYHPNIDNGGRICLDILNLPPKGAWQPSMNISTVLTSIRLLLSEPNPDDALMADISREFKYNAHVFKQTAITWTERYATPGSTSRSYDHAVLSNPHLAPLEAGKANAPENPVKANRTRKKLHLSCQNVPAKQMAATGLNTNEEENIAHAREILDKKISSASPKLLQHFSPTVNEPFETFLINKPKQVAADGSSSQDNPVKQRDGTRKKLRLTCQSLSANPSMSTGKYHNDIKDNVASIQQILEMKSSSCPELQNSGLYFEKNSLREHQKNALVDSPKQVGVSPAILESIVISDSEESDDEDNRPSRLRLSLVEPNVRALERQWQKGNESC